MAKGKKQMLLRDVPENIFKLIQSKKHEMEKHRGTTISMETALYSLLKEKCSEQLKPISTDS